jgi:phenylpyruvate tautomerase PptA (4-oxalocrotonate tautomerase family)
MPMIELTLTDGALDKDAQDALMAQLTETLLRWEGAPPTSERAKDVSWGFVDVRPAELIYHRGEPVPAQPLYKVEISIPQGALDDTRKEGLVGDMTRLVLEAEGASADDEAAAMRVWVIVREVAEGNWGAAGKVWRLRDIARFVMSEEPVARA